MKITNIDVHPLGGNQYGVEYDQDGRHIDKVVDLDGLTPVSDEDFEKLEAAGLCDDDFIAPMHADDDLAWEFACEEAVNYSGFDVDAYIEELRAEQAE